jgi:ubiquinone/menaquinone biosynthesis C-methylase UbiE
MSSTQQNLQRAYYQRTAHEYEALHVAAVDEHYLALAWLSASLEHLGCESVLDIGSGTGRAVAYLRSHNPQVRVLGVEPSAELRSVGAAKGLGEYLVDGDAMNLAYPDGSFDVVCEFGVLHHLPRPRAAIAEMLRVARRAVFISDDNHFACGSPAAQRVKRGLAAVGLWKAAYWVRSGGKGYRITESDGLAYPYSVFDDLPLLRSACAAVHCMNTKGEGPDLYARAGHVALLGVKPA